MTKREAIEAVFEDGVFKPLVAVELAQHQRVSLVIAVPDDLPAEALTLEAERGPAFAFLSDPREDVYTPDDGEPV